MMCANDRVNYGPMVILICLHITIPHYNHYAYVSECIAFRIIRQVHSLESVFKIKSFISIIFHAIHGALCILFTHFSYDDCENMSRLS